MVPVAWITVYESDYLTLVVDDEKKTAMLEVSSGGYRPRYITCTGMNKNSERLSMPCS
jgi:hypothetical protein